jgi:hypothetical protein
VIAAMWWAASTRAQAGVEAPARDAPAVAAVTVDGEAEPTPQTVEARARYQEGVSLAHAERWKDALEAFERSDALRPHAITKYNIAYCESRLGHPTLASNALTQALRAHREGGGHELPDELLSSVERDLQAANLEVARVTVAVGHGALTVDGRPLELVDASGPRPLLVAVTRPVGQPEPLPAGQVDLLLDPGTHVFVLATPGHADSVTRATLEPGSFTSLELAVPPATTSTPAAVPQSELRSPPALGPSHTAAYVAFGCGAAAVIAGSVSGFVALGKRDDVDRACVEAGSRCDRERESGNRTADISTAAFIAAGAAVGVGVWLWLAASVNHDPRAKTPNSLETQPGLRFSGTSLRGRF